MYMNIFPLDANIWGTVAEWLGAILSGIALIMVVWQTNATRKSEKELLIYTNNLERLAIIRRSINELNLVIVDFTQDLDKEKEKEAFNLIKQIKLEISFIITDMPMGSEIIDELDGLETLLDEISINRYTQPFEEYDLNKIMNFYGKRLEKIRKLEKMLWEMQKEMLSNT